MTSLPDWRVIGGAPAPGTGTSASEPARPVLSPRTVAMASAAIMAAVVVGAMAALVVMPTTGGVLIDATGADGSWTQRSADVATTGAATDAGRSGALASRSLVVDVEGAVARPGLVALPPGARVGDALERAGGFAANVDLAAAASALNLAQEVTDGLKVVVPAMGEGVPMAGGDTGPSSAGSSGPIDLNRATEAQLDSLPGVGPATIAKIVAARQEAPFATIDELRSRGIVGEATFGKLRDLVTVGR